jgi:ribonucleoside-diphosphate reductase alpha subunit
MDLVHFIRFALLKLRIVSSYAKHIIQSEYYNVNDTTRYDIFILNNKRVSILFPAENCFLEKQSRSAISDENYNNAIQNDDYFLHNNMVYCKVDLIENTKYNGYLYDLEVEGDHTYTTLMGSCHNGGGKRKGSFAFYLEPWHPEVVEFLELKLQHGDENLRARDIFTALWIPDLFMKRVKKDELWSLFCPSKIKDSYGIGLQDVYGDEFDKLYIRAETDKLYNKQVKARVLYQKIVEIQTTTSLPYMMYKDHVNNKNNQKNIGICRGSNLCTEITEFTDEDHDSVCNLASLGLPEYVYEFEGKILFNFELLGEKVRELVYNLNCVIDVNEYPVEQAKITNLKHRPIGIGVQGLADVFAKFRYVWGSYESRELNVAIFETIYYNACLMSHELAMIDGSYECFKGSPMSEGIFQFDMWNVTPTNRYDWETLRGKIKLGMRNSLLISPMPTASTAQILGNNESIEMFTEMIYSRKVLSGEFFVINKYLVEYLRQCGLWDKQMVDDIINNNGSVQNIERIPLEIRQIFKTVWEISQKTILEMSADRCAFVDQSQSTNIHIPHPTISQLSTLHMDAWELGLKTGMYYLRSKSLSDNVKFTIMQKIDIIKDVVDSKQNESTNNLLNDRKPKNKKFICEEDVCTMCSS